MGNSRGYPVPDHATHSALPQLSWPAQVAAVWALAGGVASGVLVALLLLDGRIHADGSPLLAALFAAVGGILGLVHGAVLGYLGRHAGPAVRVRLRDRLFAATAAFIAVVAAAAVSMWIVASAVLTRAGSTWGWTALFAGGVIALGIAIGATVLGWRSLEIAYAEWPEHSLGVRLVVGSFAVLCAVFLLLRPAVPGLRLQLTSMGWIAVAALATIWLATPAIVLALRVGAQRAADGTRSVPG